MSYDPNKVPALSELKKLATRTKSELAKKADKATTLAGYGITDAFTKDEVNAKVSAVYKPGGSVTFANLPSPDADHLGLVYNVTDAFTTTDAFVEGAGKKYPAGTNVVVVSVDGSFKLDALSGFVDLSGLQPKEDGKGLSTNDYTDTDKAKLEGVAAGATKVEASATPGHIKINGTDTAVVEFATDAEVTELLNEVFGPEAE